MTLIFGKWRLVHKSRLPVQGGVEMEGDDAKFVQRGPSTRLSTNNIGNILLSLPIYGW